MSTDSERLAFKEKLRSLSFKGAARPAKVTTDVHDTHQVDVIEHWDDRVDVTMRPETVRLQSPPRGTDV